MNRNPAPSAPNPRPAGRPVTAQSPPSTATRAPHRRSLFFLPAALALVVATSTACGSSDPSAGTTARPASGAASTSMARSASSSMETMIMVQDFSYAVPASVSPGAKVEVMNVDTEAHTVTSDTGGVFDITVTPGATVAFTAPSSPGSYAFHCTYHANMHGVLVVK